MVGRALRQKVEKPQKKPSEGHCREFLIFFVQFVILGVLLAEFYTIHCQFLDQVSQTVKHK
jgi:hypothetical protein